MPELREAVHDELASRVVRLLVAGNPVRRVPRDLEYPSGREGWRAMSFDMGQIILRDLLDAAIAKIRARGLAS